MSAAFVVLGIFGAGMWVGYALRVWDEKNLPKGNRIIDAYKNLTAEERIKLAQDAIEKYNNKKESI
jgi:hypothetical protein